MSLTDGEILELLQLTTRLTLHYESILAREDLTVRPYALGVDETSQLLTRLNELLSRDGRSMVLPYGDTAFLDARMVTATLAETLDIVSIRYSLEHMLDSELAAAKQPHQPKE